MKPIQYGATWQDANTPCFVNRTSTIQHPKHSANTAAMIRRLWIGLAVLGAVRLAIHMKRSVTSTSAPWCFANPDSVSAPVHVEASGEHTNLCADVCSNMLEKRGDVPKTSKNMRNHHGKGAKKEPPNALSSLTQKYRKVRVFTNPNIWKPFSWLVDWWYWISSSLSIAKNRHDNHW